METRTSGALRAKGRKQICCLPIKRAIIAWALLTAMAFEPVRADPKPLGWAAPASVVVDTEEISFRSGGTQLSGSLYVPRGPRPVPLVVVFHAASAPSRNELLYDHLKTMLPSLGIAVFAYDRRGTGRSAGKPTGNGFDQLADDGIAAARLLAADRRIDRRRVGFWGLSQGGWLSLLAASRWKETSFVISVSAPMVTPDVQMNFAVANILRIKGYSEQDVALALAARTGVDAFERGQLDRATAQKRLDAVVGKPWFHLIYMDRTFSDPDKSGWAKEIRHDPLRSIGSIAVPALVLYGSGDPWVPVTTSIDRLQGFVAVHRNFTTAVIGKADHAMMTHASPAQQIDPIFFPQQAPDSAEYFGRVAAWLQAYVIGASRNAKQ